jgi:septum site-determining protein MinD
LGILSSKSKRAEHKLEPIREYLLLTRYSPKRANLGEMLSVKDVVEILHIPLLGVIPESQAVLNASNRGVPVSLEQETDAGQAYIDAVGRFLGEDLPHRFIQESKKGFFSRLFGRNNEQEVAT